MLPISLQRAWVPVDLLEEEYVHYLEGQRNLQFEGQTTTTTNTENASGAAVLGTVGVNTLTQTQLIYLKQLALHYRALASTYEEENMFADSVVMEDRADAISTLCAANAPKVEKRGWGWGSGTGSGEEASTLSPVVPSTSMKADSKDTGPASRPAGIVSSRAQAKDTSTGAASRASAANLVVSSATSSAASTPRAPDGAPPQGQYQINPFFLQNTSNAGTAQSSRRGSASSNVSRSALVTPRNANSAALIAKWQEIDEIEDSPEDWLITPSDFFHLSRHYVQLSDMYLQEQPLPNYDEAIEARTRARTCVMGDSTSGPRKETYDISKGSVNERQYFLGIIEDLQRIRDMQVHAKHEIEHGKEQSMQAARHGRLAARAEIQVYG